MKGWKRRDCCTSGIAAIADMLRLRSLPPCSRFRTDLQARCLVVFWQFSKIVAVSTSAHYIPCEGPASRLAATPPHPIVRGVTGEGMSFDKALVGLLSKCQCWEPEGCWGGSKGDGQSPLHPPAGHVPRPMPAAPARIGSGRVPAAKPAGVGIVFRRQDPNSHAGLEVDSLTWAGPAHSSGQILAGEHLVEIDGQSIRGLDARSIARLILGPANTSVTLVFECSDGRLKSVTLTRSQQVSSPVTSPALSSSDCSPEVESTHRRSPYDAFE